MISNIRQKVLSEVNQIPDEKLPQIWDLIHHFRLGLQRKRKQPSAISKYAGCWKDMPDDVFDELSSDFGNRRKAAFARRRGA